MYFVVCTTYTVRLKQYSHSVCSFWFFHMIFIVELFLIFLLFPTQSYEYVVKEFPVVIESYLYHVSATITNISPNDITK